MIHFSVFFFLSLLCCSLLFFVVRFPIFAVPWNHSHIHFPTEFGSKERALGGCGGGFDRKIGFSNAFSYYSLRNQKPFQERTPMFTQAQPKMEWGRRGYHRWPRRTPEPRAMPLPLDMQKVRPKWAAFSCPSRLYATELCSRRDPVCGVWSGNECCKRTKFANDLCSMLMIYYAVKTDLRAATILMHAPVFVYRPTSVARSR